LGYTSLTNSEFESLVQSSSLPVILYVTSNRYRIADRAREEFSLAVDQFCSHIGVFEVDADEEQVLVSRLNIKAAPALLLFVSGTEVAALLGFYCRDELVARLWSIISDSS
jgi:thioredoxin-like negative regulator of GroEL